MAYRDLEKRKAYMKAYNKAYREANKEKEKAYEKAYREAHKDEIKAYKKAYWEVHKDERKAKCKAYNEAHKEERKAKCKAYYQANKEKHKAKMKAYRENHKEEIKAYYQTNKEKHKSWMKAYNKKRLKNDQLYAFKYNVRKMMALAFRRCGYKKNSRTENLLCCTFEELMKYLNPPKDFFTNRSKYHIDHIVPLATAKTIEDVIRLSHHTNLQILTAEENMAKGSKY